MRVKEDDQKVVVYLKEEKEKRTEYVLVVDSPDDEYVIMVFTGTLKPEDVQGIINM